MHRKEILARATELTLDDRAKTYGTPFDNLSNIAGLWSAYIIAKYRGRTLDEVPFALTAEDVAHLNELQKMARTFTGEFHIDNYIDRTAYAAIAGECRAIEETE